MRLRVGTVVHFLPRQSLLFDIIRHSVQPSSLRLCSRPSPSYTLISFLASFVTLHIHRSIRICATSNLSSCALFNGHVTPRTPVPVLYILIAHCWSNRLAFSTLHCAPRECKTVVDALVVRDLAQCIRASCKTCTRDTGSVTYSSDRYSI